MRRIDSVTLSKLNNGDPILSLELPKQSRSNELYFPLKPSDSLKEKSFQVVVKGVDSKGKKYLKIRDKELYLPVQCTNINLEK